MVLEFFKKGFKSLKFKKDRPTPLGDLEEKVMNVLWKIGNGTVREVREQLNENLAHTTVMTILDRLYKKGLLKRIKEGKSYRYFPLISKEEFEKKVAEKVITDIIRSHPETAIAAFEGAIEKLSEEEIYHLKKMIEEKMRDEKK
ncbi:MAG TPA: BlaI/MecI/CopY family transcriptional regulator [Persephonella sp.]|uniref:BlaI/MecI/CopY family transcriptional regulator n=1 Tax=Persephonella TaxID=182899 RepID=UPI000A047DFD|nr:MULTISPECIES: BlaI/MecI/CopY family transcriptional regulator [Persephonella]HCB69748.1 BlaI/MecI/CopY family transcriptional regulator [Persephonella sp.]